MNKKTTTQEHINKIIEFRQAVHVNGFGKQRDALSEALDALCVTGTLSSFPLLSLSKAFRRQWHSLYKAVERGRVREEWLSCHLAQQVPDKGIQYYSLDSSAWARPRARTVDDRQYVYHPTAAINGGSVCIGYPYSLLDWVPQAHHSWSLSVSVKRIPSSMTAGEMGIDQINRTQPKPGRLAGSAGYCGCRWQVWQCPLPACFARSKLRDRGAPAPGPRAASGTRTAQEEKAWTSKSTWRAICLQRTGNLGYS